MNKMLYCRWIYKYHNKCNGQYVTIDTKGNAIDFGDLATADRYISAHQGAFIMSTLKVDTIDNGSKIDFPTWL